MKLLRQFFRWLRHRKLGNKGEVKVGVIIWWICVGGGGLALSFLINRCNANLDEKLAANKQACQAKCGIHPVKRLNPCTCIVNEEIRE